MSGAWSDHAFTELTCFAIFATVIALAAVVDVGFGIVTDAAAVDISKALAADTIKPISTGIAACTAVVDVRLGIS